MGAAYSQDLRDRIIAARDDGMETKRVAELFRVSRSWVRRVMQRRRDHGEQCSRPRGGATVIKIDLDRLRQLVDQQPDATARQLHERLGIKCSVSAVDMALRRMGLSFKKDVACRRAGSTRCCSQTHAVASRSTRPRHTAPDLHRRDLEQDEHDAFAGQSAGR